MNKHMSVNLYRDPIAPTRNVAAFSVMLQRLSDMPITRDRMGAFSGDPGLGKTKSAAYAATTYRTRYVTCGLLTTARSLISDILMDLGEHEVRGTNIDLLNRAIFLLAHDPQRPLIIDEAHYVAQRRFVDVLRQIHDAARVPVVLIGEKSLMRRLEAFPMVRSRIGRVVAEAMPCDLDDLQLMTREHFPDLAIADDLADAVLAETGGNARAIVSLLDDINERAAILGRDDLDLSGFGGIETLRAAHAQAGAV
ncbi:MAG TPA: ATP-binding protein [Devosia sp.]|jgi:DNA transposition AAA+ family ATPase|nr:ATP-binding protein [Devosia sp.]